MISRIPMRGKILMMAVVSSVDSSTFILGTKRSFPWDLAAVRAAPCFASLEVTAVPLLRQTDDEEPFGLLASKLAGLVVDVLVVFCFVLMSDKKTELDFKIYNFDHYLAL